MKTRCESFWCQNYSADERCCGTGCDRAANYIHHNYDANGDDYGGDGYCTHCAVKQGMEYDAQDDAATKTSDFL